MPSDDPTKRPSRVLRFAVSAALLVAPAGGLAACGAADQEPEHTVNEPEPIETINEPEELPDETPNEVNEPEEAEPPTSDQGNEPSDPALRHPRTNLPASRTMEEE